MQKLMPQISPANWVHHGTGVSKAPPACTRWKGSMNPIAGAPGLRRPRSAYGLVKPYRSDVARAVDQGVVGNERCVNLQPNAHTLRWPHAALLVK